MTRITAIEIFELTSPLASPASLAWQGLLPTSPQTIEILRLRTSDGIEGISGTSFGSRKTGLSGEVLASWLLGWDSTDLDGARGFLQEMGLAGMPAWWVEAALWDLRGKREGKPLYKLLDHHLGEVTSLPALCALPSYLPPGEAVARVESLVREGWQAFRLPIRVAVGEDEALVKALRESLGDEMPVMLQGDRWSKLRLSTAHAPGQMLSEALDFVARLEPYKIEWVEDILDLYAYDDLSVLRSESAIPIAGGERYTGWHEFKIPFEKGSLDLYQPNPARIGLSTAAQVLDACLRRDLHFAPSSGFDPFARLQAAHLYAAWPHKFFLPCLWASALLPPLLRDLGFGEALSLDGEGMLSLPQTPGLGVALEPKALKAHTHRVFCVNA